MRKFEKVKRLEDLDFELPKRSTKNSAGYDFTCPVDTILPQKSISFVKTGVKAYMFENEMLVLANRSSNPKKKGLVLINGVGIVDSDYADNDENEGEIAFAFYNITDKPVLLKAGERIGQGIFMPYYTTDDDTAQGKRVGGFGSTGR